MYTADHIATGVAVAAIISRRFSMPFAPIALIFMLVNVIDFDHMMTFHLDDGYANSLVIHPLHVYSGLVMSFLGALAIFDKKRVFYYVCLMGAVAMHLGADAVSHFLGYDERLIISMSAITFVGIFFVLRYCIEEGSYLKLFAFLVAQWVIICGATLTGALHLSPPQEYMSLWAISPALTIITAGVFWKLFAGKIHTRPEADASTESESLYNNLTTD